MIIGVSGVARSGKDTFYNLLCKCMEADGMYFKRFAFADKLKADIRLLLKNNFNIDIYNCSDEDKEKVRPLMVTYGKLAREIDEQYWINKLMPQILSYKDPRTPVITDVRYENEQLYLKKRFDNCINIYISRVNFNPANEEEALNDPKLKENADYTLHWGTFNRSEDEGIPQVQKFINERIKRRTIN
jgi:hypothetical protein